MFLAYINCLIVPFKWRTDQEIATDELFVFEWKNNALSMKQGWPQAISSDGGMEIRGLAAGTKIELFYLDPANSIIYI
jgi:hypothetical protein